MRKKIVIIGILLVLILLSGAFLLYTSGKRKANLEKAQKFYDLGLSLEKKRDFGNALKNFKLALKFAPSRSSISKKAQRKIKEVERKVRLSQKSGGEKGGFPTSEKGGKKAGGKEGGGSPEGSTGGSSGGGSSAGGGSSGGSSSGGSSSGEGGTYFPEITGFIGGSILKGGDNTTYRIYDYVQGDDLSKLLITVYNFSSEEEAAGFASRVSAQLYKDETKTVDFEDVKNAFYGENRERNKSTIVWAKGKITVEIILSAFDAPISNYYRYLVEIAEKVNH